MGPDGETLTHILHSKYGWRNFWFIIDEANYISAGQWAWIARFAFVGVKFLICGDFPGQFLPISAQWEKFDYDKLEFSDEAFQLSPLGGSLWPRSQISINVKFEPLMAAARKAEPDTENLMASRALVFYLCEVRIC